MSKPLINLLNSKNDNLPSAGLAGSAFAGAVAVSHECPLFLADGGRFAAAPPYSIYGQ